MFKVIFSSILPGRLNKPDGNSLEAQLNANAAAINNIDFGDRQGEVMYKLFSSLLIFSMLTLPISVSAHEGEDHEHSEEAASSELESGNGWRLVRKVPMGDSGKFIHLVLVDHAVHTDRTIYSAAINRLCGPEDEFCRIRFWSQEKYVPEKASMTVDQNKHLRADYLVNKEAGMQHLRWSCSVNPDKNHCF